MRPSRLSHRKTEAGLDAEDRQQRRADGGAAELLRVAAAGERVTWIRRESTKCRSEAARGVSLWVPAEGRQHRI